MKAILSIEHGIGYKFDEVMDPAEAEYDIQRNTRRTSRRSVKYDKEDNTIKHIHNPRNNISLHQSPGGHEIFEHRSYVTNELNRRNLDEADFEENFSSNQRRMTNTHYRTPTKNVAFRASKR